MNLRFNTTNEQSRLFIVLLWLIDLEMVWYNN